MYYQIRTSRFRMFVYMYEQFGTKCVCNLFDIIILSWNFMAYGVWKTFFVFSFTRVRKLIGSNVPYRNVF